VPKREPEARYAYYRRCQRFRRNGEQCKAPAMKGEAICYRHAEQAASEESRARQRRELLATPALGFGSFRAVQRTIGAVAQALLDDRVDRKTAGRLAVELQTASKLLWQQRLLNRKNLLNHEPLNHSGHGATQSKTEELSKQELRNEGEKANTLSPGHDGAQRKEGFGKQEPGKEREKQLTANTNRRDCRRQSAAGPWPQTLAIRPLAAKAAARPWPHRWRSRAVAGWFCPAAQIAPARDGLGIDKG
jgi:hypothetical protein